MADIKIYTIQFVGTYGSYVYGDKLDIFWDDTAPPLPTSGSISVEKNGTPLGSGDTIPIYSDYVTIVNVPIISSFCYGTTLEVVSRVASFPYVTFTEETNSHSCGVPIVCDLAFGVPDITNESSEGSADGQIAVSASSSNGSIKYKLNEDFVYNDGTGQVSGIFTDLTEGEYRVFARDEENCQANILLTVGVDVTYGTKYQLEYYDEVGYKTKLEIKKKNYAGAVDDLICGTGDPFNLTLRGEGEKNKFRPIIATEGVINFLATSSLDWTELFTSDPEEYRLVYSKDFDTDQTLMTDDGFLLLTDDSEYLQVD